jgi:hypothetical protein
LLEALLGGDLQSSGFKAGVPEEKHDDDEAGGEGDSEPLGIDDTVSVNENAPQGGMSLNEKPSPTVE